MDRQKYKFAIVDGMTDTLLSQAWSDGYTVYLKQGSYALSTRKLEGLIRIAEMQKYFQCNPVRFFDIMFNIELIDAQAFIVQRSWNCPNVLVVATRGLGKSTVIDLILMGKDMLFCNYWAYIASGTGSQAEQTFTVLEKLANDNIDSFRGSTGKIFKDEIERKNTSGDGFSHSASGFTYNTYNGSMTQTLNSNIDAKRGARGSVIFDECGFLSEEMLNVYGAFAIVDRDFVSGKDRDGHSIDPIRQRTFPMALQNQKFYISSASSTDMKFYALYKEFALNEIAGNPDYCVIHLDCEIAFRPTIRGKVVAPLLSREIVANELRTNPEKALREYYCQFTTDAGINAIIKRSTIIKNSEIRVPLLSNPDSKCKFVIAYDPARSRDNSIIAIGMIYQDALTGEYKMRIVNCINLLDISKKKRTPMQTPEQIKYLKNLILAYNGDVPDYENICALMIDAGSGGGGVNVGDYLMESWTDDSGVQHRGLIDREFSANYVSKFPQAIDKVKLMSPVQYKSDMFEAMIEMINQGLISFTADYDHKGYLTLFDVDEEVLAREKDVIAGALQAEHLSAEKFEQRMREELQKVSCIKTKVRKLDQFEEMALGNIDAMKEELVNIVRRKRESSKDSFDLSPDKATRLNDDRCYCLAMLAYYLQGLRREQFMQKQKKRTATMQFYVKPPKKVTQF